MTAPEGSLTSGQAPVTQGKTKTSADLAAKEVLAVDSLKKKLEYDISPDLMHQKIGY